MPPPLCACGGCCPGEDIVPFLQPLVERLTQLLRDSTRETQEMAISALASVAMAAGEQFRPYFVPVYSLMKVLLHQTGEAELNLRARSMECIGLMNLAVGREVCEPVLQEVTMAALQGLQLDLPELREYTYVRAPLPPPPRPCCTSRLLARLPAPVTITPKA